MKHENPYAEAPCANSDDPDAWFINKNGKLDPEDAKEIRDRHAAAAKKSAEMSGDEYVLSYYLDVAEGEADEEIAELEQLNRRRLRAALRACYFDCPMRLRLKCLDEGLEEPYGVRGGYTEGERRQMVKIRDEHNLTGRRVVDIAISADRRSAMEEDGGGDRDGDQSPGRTQPQAPEAGANDNDTREAP